MNRRKSRSPLRRTTDKRSAVGVPSTEQAIREALRAIIDGKAVKRSRHDLHLDGKDLTPLFVEELERRNYRATTVGASDVRPGERTPAFYLIDGVAYFGWVFWEQFTSAKLRKLWGSMVKNAKGDWEIQIPSTRSTTIFANELEKIEMDIDHPSEL